MKLSLSVIALACAVSALPPGPLYAERLPRDFNDRLVERDNGGSATGYKSVDSGNYFADNGFDKIKDPESNITLPYPPTYRALTPFDYASLNLGLYQEYIELDLFHNGLARFSAAEFDAAGITQAQRDYIGWMADQEVAHATLLTSLLGPGAAQQCKYQYPFTNVREFVDFCQLLTRWGESGVYGFLSKLNSPDSASLLLQSIATEARQQMSFRQMGGAFPMPESFIPGIPQAWQWTLLARYITSCPAGTPSIQWSHFPILNVTRASTGVAPALVSNNSQSAVSTNVTAPIIAPSEKLILRWGNTGEKVGPDGAYTTSRMTSNPAKYAMFVSHINATYAELFDVTSNSATVYAPTPVPVYASVPDIHVVNATAFVIVTDAKVPITPYNLTMINAHLVAGPSMIQFG